STAPVRAFIRRVDASVSTPPLLVIIRMQSAFLLFIVLFIKSAIAVASAAGESGAGLRLGVALYGSNGHQLRPDALEAHPNARLVAVAAVGDRFLPAGSTVRQYASLDEMLNDPEVQLVSLCSPRRLDQARDAIRCLEAG